MTDIVTLKRYTGDALGRYIEEVAKLRIEIFREYPYLYDGNMEYEEKYLRTYTASPNSVVVIAFAGDQVVGASTAIPLCHEIEEFKTPFLTQNIDPQTVFYLGESVLKKSYRGRGIGVRFFHERESHARSIGNFAWSAFCAVVRPDSHPLRPSDYKPLDEFWNKRGYFKHPELQTNLSWKDIDESTPTSKPMMFWLKDFSKSA